MGSECAKQGAVLRLCALVVRSAAGLEDDAEPVLTTGSEAARVLALSAKAEHDAARAEVGGITTALRHACDQRDEARAEVEDIKLSHESRRQRASLGICHLRGAFKLRAGTQYIEDATQQAAERHRMARERIADLEHYVGEYLSHTGACSGSDDDGDGSLCSNPRCQYCEMARALQPGECGRPLTPRGEEGGSDDD